MKTEPAVTVASITAAVMAVIVNGRDVALGELLMDSFAGRVESYVTPMRYFRESLLDRLA